MSVHYKGYSASATSETIASRLYGCIISGDNNPGTAVANSNTVNGVDKLLVDCPGYIDSGVAGAPMVIWFNLANPSAGIPCSNFDVTLAANNSLTLLFEPA